MWMSNVAHEPLRKLLKHIRCREPVEMLSVYARAMIDTTIMAIPSTQIRKQADEIRRVRRTMYEQFGREAHPGVVLRSSLAV